MLHVLKHKQYVGWITMIIVKDVTDHSFCDVAAILNVQKSKLHKNIQ
jgi:hypothetical protein